MNVACPHMARLACQRQAVARNSIVVRWRARCAAGYATFTKRRLTSYRLVAGCLWLSANGPWLLACGL